MEYPLVGTVFVFVFVLHICVDGVSVGGACFLCLC